MTTKLYVGNLSYSVRDNDLQQQFSPFGNVVSAQVMMERDSGRSKGFGFVEMSTAEEAQAAIEGLHEQPMGGRNLNVNVARPREEGGGSYRNNNGGGGYRGNNGGGYGGGNGGGYGGNRY
ncbi:RNA recognition motif domain-containing protein [Comamonas jiangduensis]|uniref:RNA recognition motif domain-containing protein n=1 Tax=Comamonas jiangduensis TaxID=1194168 RepID=UPI0028ADA6D8|nr:RNA-binding protein [Comamonas jiangduensis]